MRSGQTVQAFIGLGSNLGNGQQLLLSAWRRFAVEGRVVPFRLSSLYVTEAVGMDSRSLFTNAVGLVETVLEPTELLQLLLQVETEHGRLRDANAVGYQDRFLDLDLLYFGGTVWNSPELVLPHPHIASRLFVLAPLVEISPWLQDPLTGLTVEEMYQQLLARIEQGEILPQPISRIERTE
ncbi:MAG: 2-amino-4-hydroxy-6-hydroxymethyldihydropteridine diphosphokinase [Proteobacteria bacterium]|nr:2-amino-4-hydroxy-6-hydroxymethyldihydropteridine diphosphokinase [Pseudomonadota bacterium]MBU1649687.1 2-amino-4-hydroxy-6-hydroxymethyldihydropteridine diphosphokinase [Pseudomonadota bacterium]MBU1986178.1 2-amino-4-hydroxy-6-hydroxymethyldihydropteridine diphosphokinase [Pseudomonadota bacterium]